MATDRRRRPRRRDEDCRGGIPGVRMAGAFDNAFFARGETLASSGRRGVEARDDGVRRRRVSRHFARLPEREVSNSGRGIARRLHARRAAHRAVDRARVVRLDVQAAGHAEGREPKDAARGDRRAARRDGGRALGRRRTGRGRAGISLVGDASPQAASDANGGSDAARSDANGGPDASCPDASRPDAAGSDAVARDADRKRAAAARGVPPGTGIRRALPRVRPASCADAKGSPPAREPRVYASRLMNEGASLKSARNSSSITNRLNHKRASSLPRVRVQRLGEHPRVEVGGEHAPAEVALEQNQPELPVRGFLVHGHELLERLHGHALRDVRRQIELLQQVQGAPRDALVDPPEPLGHVRRHHHPHGNSLTVKPLAVPDARLDRVSERVPQVERRADASFLLVQRHHLGFVHAGSLDGFYHDVSVARHERVDVALLPLEKVGVANQPVLHHLGHPGFVLPVGKRGQRVRVDEHAPRLVKRADHVFPRGVVHARLAADGGVDHGHDRRGNLHEVHAPLVRRGGEAGHVADHAAAERHERGLPVQSRVQGFVENLHQHVHVFVLLSVGKDHRLHADLAAFRQRGDDSIEVQGRDGLVGHHQRGVPRHVLAEKVSPGEQARTDVDRIRSIPQLDLHRGGGRGRGDARRHDANRARDLDGAKGFG